MSTPKLATTHCSGHTATPAHPPRRQQAPSPSRAVMRSWPRPTTPPGHSARPASSAELPSSCWPSSLASPTSASSRFSSPPETQPGLRRPHRLRGTVSLGHRRPARRRHSRHRRRLLTVSSLRVRQSERRDHGGRVQDRLFDGLPGGDQPAGQRTVTARRCRPGLAGRRPVPHHLGRQLHPLRRAPRAHRLPGVSVGFRTKDSSASCSSWLGSDTSSTKLAPCWCPATH